MYGKKQEQESTISNVLLLDTEIKIKCHASRHANLTRICEVLGTAAARYTGAVRVAGAMIAHPTSVSTPSEAPAPLWSLDSSRPGSTDAWNPTKSA